MQTERRLARLETQIEHASADLDQIKNDMREVRDAIVAARGSWKFLVAAVGLASALGVLIDRMVVWVTRA